jgi:hypothetical protein
MWEEAKEWPDQKCYTATSPLFFLTLTHLDQELAHLPTASQGELPINTTNSHITTTTFLHHPA